MLTRNFLRIFLAAGLSCGCSSVAVDVGNNGKAPKSQGPQTGPSGTSPTGPADSPSAQGTSSGTSRTESAAAGTCFGQSTATSLSADFQKMCDEFPEASRVEYATALKLLCEEKRLVNLIYEQCGWEGTDDPGVDAFFRVLEYTDLADSGSDFYYLSTSSVNLPSRPGNRYLDATRMAYGDSDRYQSIFEMPENTRVIGNDGVQVVDGIETIEYDVEVNAMSLTKFHAKIEIYPISPTFTLIINRAISDKVGVKERKNLTIVSPLGSDKEKIVTIEERLVPDQGLHQIALQLLNDFDLKEMQMRYRNSQVEY